MGCYRTSRNLLRRSKARICGTWPRRPSPIRPISRTRTPRGPGDHSIRPRRLKIFRCRSRCHRLYRRHRHGGNDVPVGNCAQKRRPIREKPAHWGKFKSYRALREILHFQLVTNELCRLSGCHLADPCVSSTNLCFSTLVMIYGTWCALRLIYIYSREVSTRRTKKQDAKVGKSLPNKGLRHFSVKVRVPQSISLSRSLDKIAEPR